MNKIDHWSGLNLADRVKILGKPLEEVYQLFYRLMSWHVHSGTATIIGVPKETYPHICAHGYWIAAITFEEVIKAVAREFKLSLAILHSMQNSTLLDSFHLQKAMSKKCKFAVS
jgi:hypothetical protein